MSCIAQHSTRNIDLFGLLLGGGCEFPHNVMRVEMCTKIQTRPPGFTMFIQKGYKRPQWYKAWSVFTMIPPRGEGRTSIIPVLLKHQHHKGLYNMPRKATARHFSTQLLDTKIKGSVRPVRRAEWDGGRRCVKSDELLELLSQRIRLEKVHHFWNGYWLLTYHASVTPVMHQDTSSNHNDLKHVTYDAVTSR